MMGYSPRAHLDDNDSYAVLSALNQLFHTGPTGTNVADIAGTKVWADFIPYSVSKAGLLALTTGLAKALAPAVQVNAVSPGVVLLPDGIAPDEHARTVQRVPLRRLGTPEDIARAAVYLIESDFVTGDVLTVDGGQRLL